MKTITFYKVVCFDQYNDMLDYDFQTEQQARAFASDYNDAQIYKYQMLADVVDIT